MPPDNLAQTPFQKVSIQRTRNVQSSRDIVPGFAGFQLFQEPNPLLSKRKYRLVISGMADGKCRRRIHFFPKCVNPPGQLGECGSSKNCINRNFRLKNGSHSRRELSREQGMAPELKEVAIGSNTFEVEQLTEDIGKPLLC